MSPTPAEARTPTTRDWHTQELPATPQRDFLIPADRWVEAPPELRALGTDIGEPVVIKFCRDCPVNGDEYIFEPPLVVPPSLISANTAARLASASFEVERDRVVLSWPNA